MIGHSDTITSLDLSPDGQQLLSNSMDSTLRIWNVATFAPVNRQIRVLRGAAHGFEKNSIRARWSPDGRFVIGGSAERTVLIWDADNGKVKQNLGGHHGVVNDVDFHPTENVIASGSTDRTVLLGEVVL